MLLESVEAAKGGYDCIVVGSGPAGISLAVGLASVNRRVLIIESGGESVDPSLSNTIGYGHYGGNHWNVHSVRAIGGTSRVWSGFVATMSELAFDNASVGARWPIRRPELVPYYRRAAAVLDRDPSIVDFETRFGAGFLYRPFSLAAPTRFASKYGFMLRSKVGIDVVQGNVVVGIDADDSRRVVRSLRCFEHGVGATRDVAVAPSQAVVLAAGGIGNAQLLLQPQEDGQPPVGNESGQVGRFLMEHPHFYGAAECVLDEDLDRFLPPPAFGTAVPALVADPEQARAHGLFDCNMECGQKTTDHELAQYLSADLGRPFYHYTMNIRTEMLPSESNRVFLTGERDRSGLYRPAARCVLDARDLINAETTLRLLGSSLIESGKGRIRVNNSRLYGQPGGGGHIMGTTRMGDSPSMSVVDRDCRVHGYDNLFVAGSSVFPTTGYANPTLTIVALALRLADAIAQRARQ